MQNIFGSTTHGAGDVAVEEPVAPWWLKPAMVGRGKPSANQAEADPSGNGLNIRSDYGQRLRNAILFSGSGADLAGLGLPQIATRPKVGYDAAGRVVREMAPLYNPPSGGGGSAAGFRDFLGAFASRMAFIIVTRNAIRYQGQLPTDVQPVLSKPLPWDDPTRGMP